MRIDVSFRDRVGIAQEILALLAAQSLNLSAVEVAPPHIFIDVPALAAPQWLELRTRLMRIPGVLDAQSVDFLPGARQRLHLDALLASMADPVLLVDGEGRILVSNAAALSAAGLSAAQASGLSLAALFDKIELQRELVDNGFHALAREVFLRGQPFQLDVTPVSEDGRPAGGVLTLYSAKRLGERVRALHDLPENGFDSIIGASPPMRDLRQRAARVANLNAPLLILGETGTGKELVAQACHHMSSRRRAPFLALNCAAVPENLAESELFGYAPGAFSGAARGGKPGLLEMAANGAVFLDEIGEMSLYLQAKLLRFLNDGSFRRVGGDRELKVDVRIISATHRDLTEMVATGAFREDLFYRLDVLQLKIPPLRERGADILLLANHFVARASAQVGRPGIRLSKRAETMLMSSQWPGNVRQLENTLFRTVAMSDSAEVELMPMACDAKGSASPQSLVAPIAPHDEPESWRRSLEGYERALLSQLYPHYPSSRKLAARLGVSHTMIARKLHQYGLV